MSILVDENTKVLIQGITGREGARACREMLGYGTKVVAGVTPGKGGQEVEGVPVYNSVKEALVAHSDIDTALVVVPARFVRDAVLEDIENGIELINVLAEHVTVQDSAYILAHARKAGVQIVGPSSVGIMSPKKAKLGSIGSGEISDLFTPGNIGVISKSGGMTAEICVVLSRAGFGQSTAVGIGGDPIVGSDFVDILELFEHDDETKAVVLFGEVGGVYEERVAEYVKLGKITKPIVAIIAGGFTQDLPLGTVLGHAGTIVMKGRGSYDSKIKALTDAGVAIAETVEEIPALLKKVLQ